MTPAIKITTKHECLRNPIRAFDWAAWVDGEEEGFIGRGPTEAAAIDNLLTALNVLHCRQCNSERITDRVYDAWWYHLCLDCGERFNEEEI